MSLDNLSKDLLKMASSFKDGKEAKSFLMKAGNKLKSKTVKAAKSKVKDKTGNYIRSIKRGKVYEFDGDLSVRNYSAAPHAHLIEKGHIIKDRTGKEHGFKRGHHVFEEASKDFEEEFYEGIEEFIDKVIKESGF